MRHETTTAKKEDVESAFVPPENKVRIRASFAAVLSDNGGECAREQVFLEHAPLI